MSRLPVISPVRNEAAQVEHLVRSVSAQTRRPDLWGVADDGSNEATPMASSAAAAELPFLRVLSVPIVALGRDNEARGFLGLAFFFGYMHGRLRRVPRAEGRGPPPVRPLRASRGRRRAANRVTDQKFP